MKKTIMQRNPRRKLVGRVSNWWKRKNKFYIVQENLSDTATNTVLSPVDTFDEPDKDEEVDTFDTNEFDTTDNTPATIVSNFDTAEENGEEDDKFDVDFPILLNSRSGSSCHKSQRLTSFPSHSLPTTQKRKCRTESTSSQKVSLDEHFKRNQSKEIAFSQNEYIVETQSLPVLSPAATKSQIPNVPNAFQERNTHQFDGAISLDAYLDPRHLYRMASSSRSACSLHEPTLPKDSFSRHSRRDAFQRTGSSNSLESLDSLVDSSNESDDHSYSKDYRPDGDAVDTTQDGFFLSQHIDFLRGQVEMSRAQKIRDTPLMGTSPFASSMLLNIETK